MSPSLAARFRRGHNRECRRSCATLDLLLWPHRYGAYFAGWGEESFEPVAVCSARRTERRTPQRRRVAGPVAIAVAGNLPTRRTRIGEEIRRADYVSSTMRRLAAFLIWVAQDSFGEPRAGDLPHVAVGSSWAPSVGNSVKLGLIRPRSSPGGRQAVRPDDPGRGSESLHPSCSPSATASPEFFRASRTVCRRRCGSDHQRRRLGVTSHGKRLASTLGGGGCSRRLSQSRPSSRDRRLNQRTSPIRTQGLLDLLAIATRSHTLREPAWRGGARASPRRLRFDLRSSVGRWRSSSADDGADWRRV